MKPGKNDPCSCGSGIKFKKCCGQTTQNGVLRNPIPINPARSCGSCTACCDGWLKANIYGHEMEPGTPCHFVRHGGCSIYEERPEEPCRRFECAWKEIASPLPQAFRPDRVGIIILRIKWRDRNAYRLVSTGHDPSLEVLAWMRAWSQHTGYPFFYEEADETLGYGPKAFLDDMQQRQARGEPLW